MKKKLLTIIFIYTLALSLVGCAETVVNVNVENNSSLANTVLGKDALIKIGNGLWYDSTTRIVYWWNGRMNIHYSDTVPTPYYAPNGFPYRYNPETNTFEEINN